MESASSGNGLGNPTRDEWPHGINGNTLGTPQGPTDGSFGGTTQTGGPNCKNQLLSSTLPIRVLFVIDTSGSNVRTDNQYDPPRPPTDPEKYVRGDSLQRFYNTYYTRANFRWGMLTFSGDVDDSSAARSLLSPFASASPMKEAIKTFAMMRDEGGTPYLPPLQKAATSIASSAQSDSATTRYIVVFISDGRPNPEIDSAELDSVVDSIIAAAPGRVSLNTIYYGKDDPDAIDRLAGMASRGNGNFLNTNTNPSGGQFSISDLVILPGVVCDDP